MKALSLHNVSIAYSSQWTGRKTLAIKDVSFSIGLGEAVGYIGTNGAGKTSTIKAILSLIIPASGEISIFEMSSVIRMPVISSVTYLNNPIGMRILQSMKPSYFMDPFLGSPKRETMHRAIPLLDRLELVQKRSTKMRELSKGLMQRVGLIQTLINRPKLLILDEPFSGLDPLARKVFREIFLEEKKNGAAILISSHILPDVEALCDRALIIHNQTVQADTPLKDPSNKSLEEIFTSIAGPQTL